MKKILLVILLALTLSGCGDDNNPESWSNWEKDKYCNSYLFDEYDDEPVCIEFLEYLESQSTYTQEEVDELLSELALGILFADFHTLALVEDDFYTKDELDEGFEDVLIYLQELEERISELENPN